MAAVVTIVKYHCDSAVLLGICINLSEIQENKRVQFENTHNIFLTVLFVVLHDLETLILNSAASEKIQIDLLPDFQA